MARKLVFALLLGSMLLMLGCQTTGDPRQGGLWGWSEEKAQQRISDRERPQVLIGAGTTY